MLTMFTPFMSCTDRINVAQAAVNEAETRYSEAMSAHDNAKTAYTEAKKSGDAYRKLFSDEKVRLEKLLSDERAFFTFPHHQTEERLEKIVQLEADLKELTQPAKYTKRELACSQALEAAAKVENDAHNAYTKMLDVLEEQKLAAIARYTRIQRKREAREAFEAAQTQAKQEREAAEQRAATEAAEKEAAQIRKAAWDADKVAKRAAKQALKAANVIEIVRHVPTVFTADITPEQFAQARAKAEQAEKAYRAVRNTRATASKHYEDIVGAAQAKADKIGEAFDVVEAGDIVAPSFEEVEKLVELEAAKRLKAMHEAQTELMDIEDAWRIQNSRKPVVTLPEPDIAEVSQLLAEDVLRYEAEYVAKPGDERPEYHGVDGRQYFNRRGAQIRAQRLQESRETIVKAAQRELREAVSRIGL